MHDPLYLLHWKEPELQAALRTTMIETVGPQVRAVIAEAGAKLGGQFENTPFANYLAQELIIKALADLLTLSDTYELQLLRPAMLDDTYLRTWFTVNIR
jgi:hypothetical protein